MRMHCGSSVNSQLALGAINCSKVTSPLQGPSPDPVLYTFPGALVSPARLCPASLASCRFTTELMAVGLEGTLLALGGYNFSGLPQDQQLPLMILLLLF